MSLCINPSCRQPNHPDNGGSSTCMACGSALVLQDRYRVMRLISSDSGFGRVYEAYERNVPKILKVLKEGYNTNDKVVELFRREAQVLSQLNHPGVPRVESEGYFLYHPANGGEPSHCLVMEKIEGPNLKQWMVQQGNHPISEKQAMLWLTQLTDVLDLVHQHNYFHRDIKPENVMLRPSGQLVLVDFGAAREMTQTYMANLGDSGITTVSSAGYTPPEQEQGQAVPQSDFYALGRTLIYLMTAKLPNDPAIYNSRTNAFAWRLAAPQISAPLADLIDNLIAPAAANRPQNTEAILERLAQVRSRQVSGLPRPASAAAPTWPMTTLNPHEAQTLPKPSHSFLPPWLDQRPWLLAGLTGLALAVPLGWYALSRGAMPLAGNGPRVTAPALENLTVSPVSMLTGHENDIYDLLLLRDGKTLISASADSTIRIWNLEDNTLRHTLAHSNVVQAIATTVDQTTLISTGDDRTIRFWSLPDGRPLGQIDNAHGTPIRALEVSRNGRTLVSADSEGAIKLWPLTGSTGALNLPGMADGGPSHTLQADGTLNDLLFTRDNSMLVSGGKSLQLWDLASLEDPNVGADSLPTTLEGHTSFINRIDITDDDQTLVSASADQNVLLWDMATKAKTAALEGHQGYVNTLRLEGPLLWSADADKTILVWDLQQKAPIQRITGFETDIWRFTVQPNGQIITIGGTQPYIRLWRLDQSPES
ncbi:MULTISPECIES: serine/threonine-protein kinase [Cyanophyceae]|uniref:serine/threonine-protein kinase n=1 Tax=Cyanophyceae TaxID=3028117 RepID=UPI001684C7C4|nr:MULTISPECIES: serine/threonine-protein kinase [Cyanophyceae]MBD1915904.1 serine/threonine protein kinase [Phormidium sp. FACHB-77]MBD2030422.1 serine/threonine protein kinase [Phormidium sp. FACHB-322]MBD2053424.1 serine/threonine protein kinase [Leptolyngbya sp. FACHB-60]